MFLLCGQNCHHQGRNMFLFFAVIILSTIVYYQHRCIQKTVHYVTSIPAASLARQRHWGEQPAWCFQIWWIKKDHLHIADTWNVCVSFHLTAQILFMLNILLCANHIWVYSIFQSYITLVNMPTALQINLQTDGKSDLQLRGMFLSQPHGIKVSSGMSQGSQPSTALCWSAWLEDTRMDRLTM